MTKDRLIYLLTHYRQHTLSAAETAELDQWYEAQQEAAAGEGLPDEAVLQQYMQEWLKEAHEQIRLAEAPAYRLQTGWLTRMKPAGWIAAAAVLAIMVLSVAVYRHTKEQVIAKHSTTVTADSTAGGYTMEQVENNTARLRTINLPDGSVIALSPNSSLRYPQPFGSHRALYLQGKAYFKVAGNAAHPFTVYSHGIATTALGTAFTVTAFTTGATVQVQLHEGRVVVKSADSTQQQQMVYLQPGQLVDWNLQQGVYAVKAIRKEEQRDSGLTGKTTTPVADEDMSFDQEPLTEVFAQLQVHYHVQLKYDATQLQEMNFSGHIKKGDPLTHVLQRIAVLYNLTITQTHNGYQVRKQ